MPIISGNMQDLSNDFTKGMIMAPRFIHLRLHTEYSLSDGLITINQLMAKMTDFAMPSCAITDQSNVFAAVKFYKEALKKGVKPIIGADLWLLSEDNNAPPFRFTLLCLNNEGYKNLLLLISKSYLENQQNGKALIKMSWLKAYASGLIMLSGAEEGDVGYYLLSQKNNEAIKCLQEWQRYFPNNYYFELRRIGAPSEEFYIKEALKLAERFSIPVVATNDVRFLESDDFEAHEARVCIHAGNILSDPKRPRKFTPRQYLCDEKTMLELFKDIPSALANTVAIAIRCNVNLAFDKNFLPNYAVPPGLTTEQYLIQQAEHGLNERLTILLKTLKENTLIEKDAYYHRLEHELTVINNMGFAGYFLIVADFIRWARENDVPVGPGRGSGPGSLVAFALKITDLDPLAHDLLFERFLNPERVSMPDFDIDFCMSGRDKVIEYVMQTHGRDSVAQIITYGTMAARAVLRDVGRVLGFPYGFVDKLAKLIPFELGMTLQKAFQQEILLKERYEKEEDVKTLFDLAKKLEGITRNVGKHAGGVVIAPSKLTNYTALYCEYGSEHIVTQFDKDDVEAVGLVKFDFLGLRTLTIIDWTVKQINQLNQKNNKPALNISLLPIDDEATFNMLKTCSTTAIFQLESRGMKDLVKRLQPDCFEDIVALVALFRPGPLQSGMVDDFINRKHKRAKVSYSHPNLMPVLKSTYGVILYQEQVMQIAQVLAGYSLGAADLLRRAMGKKKPEEMAKQREIFCKGAQNCGIDLKTAMHIFDLMEKFAGYGFNKSHSASYALITYQTAWLKTHYKAAFMAAVLSSDMDNTDKVVHFIEECTALKIEIAKPDINSSEFFFKMVNEEKLLYGLGAIKGVGEAAIENIILARHHGTFTDLFNFCERIDCKKVNRRALEALIKAGALDGIAPNRATLLANLENALKQAAQTFTNESAKQCDLLSTLHISPLYIETPPMSEEEKLLGEKETLGFYLTGHPFTKYEKELKHFTSASLKELKNTRNKTATIAGIITHIRIMQTKRGERMAIIMLDDQSAKCDVLCFADVFHKNRELLIKDRLLILEGEVSFDEYSGENRIICRELFSLEKARLRFAKYLEIKVSLLKEDNLKNLQELIKAHQHKEAKCKISITYQKETAKANLFLGDNWRVLPSETLIKNLRALFSDDAVNMVY